VKITVDAGEFADAAAFVARVLPKANVTPILAGILIKADGDTVTLSAFDYEVSARAVIDATVHTAGRTLVSGKVLADLAGKLPAGLAELVADTRLNITATGMAARIPAMPVDDYPALPGLPAEIGRIDATVLRGGIERVITAAGRDSTLPILTAVAVEPGETLTLTATDRYRVAVIDLAWKGAIAEGDAKAVAPIAVPAHALREVSHAVAKTVTGPVLLHYGTGEHGNGLFGVSWDGRQMTTRLVEGQFPPYRKILIKADAVQTTIAVAQGDILEAIGRVAPVAERTSPLRIAAVDGTVTLTAGSGGGSGEAIATVDATVDGDDVAFAVNPNYLKDAVEAAGGTVHIGVVNPDKAMRIACPDDEALAYVLMPIRLP
jgi:DNA polymerase-3 subunit beta